MTEKRFRVINHDDYELDYITDNNKRMHIEDVCDLLNELHEENKQLKSDLARIIEQAKKNNELLISDIRTLEKALWCHGCENDYDRLRELQKEFLND